MAPPVLAPLFSGWGGDAAHAYGHAHWRLVEIVRQQVMEDADADQRPKTAFSSFDIIGSS